MTDIDEIVEGIALAHGYDPVKAREYYLRTRKLKGRKVGTAVTRTTTAVSTKTTAPANAYKAQKVAKAQKKADRARKLIERLPDSARKVRLLARLEVSQKRLNAYKKKKTPVPLHTQPDKSGRLPGDPEYGNDPPATGRKQVKK